VNNYRYGVSSNIRKDKVTQSPQKIGKGKEINEYEYQYEFI
jgi:hypothetical protein